MSLQQQVKQEFHKRFGAVPSAVVRAPGRVNLIGEHTDYNDGFVLPMAINRATYIALRPRDDQQVRAHSLDFDQTVTFPLDDLENRNLKWAEYVKGVAWVLKAAGYTLRGWDGVLAGDVPIGAGLSSSASVELATARAFGVTSNLPWDAATMARLAQRAENEWVGMNCGIMDQMISAAGVENHALLIDCRSLETQLVPLPPNTSVVVLDTATRRGLVDSAYNERRRQCEEAARFFGVPALRDVTMAQFLNRADGLDDVARRRARHIISENDRTVEAAKAMRQGNAAALGQLMNASHDSLCDDFEVSSDNLNIMVQCAQAQDGCHGARMTGAGFGGCAVALVRSEVAQNFADAVSAAYQQAANLKPNIYVCSATNGAEVL